MARRSPRNLGRTGEQLPTTRIARRRLAEDADQVHGASEMEPPPPLGETSAPRVDSLDAVESVTGASVSPAPSVRTRPLDRVSPAEPALLDEGIGEGDALCILHVVAPTAAGGLETVVRLLAGGHSAKGHQVHVAAVVGEQGWDHPFVSSLAGSGASVIPLRLPNRAYRRERESIRAWCRVLRPDVVHTHGYRTDVLDAGVARALDMPTVTTVHGRCGGGWRNQLYEWMQIRSMRRFDAVVSVSRPLAAQLVQAGIAPQRLHLIPNAYEPSSEPLDRTLARRILGVEDERFLVGWVGRLSPEKGPDLMVGAVAALASHHISVAVLGDGRERARLRSLAWELGVSDRIHWHGTIPDAGRLFPAFDLLLLSSRTEGTPMVLLEAMAARVPIVATRVGGVEDLLTADDALLVAADDAASLANAILEACHEPEAAHARALSAHARLLAQYGVAPWLDRYELLYRELQRRRLEHS